MVGGAVSAEDWSSKEIVKVVACGKCLGKAKDSAWEKGKPLVYQG
mgnify:CR=1 FL=1